MIPPDVPILPPMTLMDVLGPVVPLLVLGVFAGLAVLIGLIAIASRAVRRATPRPIGASAWPGSGPAGARRRSVALS